MLTLDGTASAQIVADVRGVPLLVELDFTTGTQYYTNWGDNLIVGGHTYIGVGDLVQIRGLSESDDLAARTLTFALGLVNSALLAAATGNANTYRRKAARIYLQLVDTTYQPVGAAVQRWAGYMDQVSIERSAPASVVDQKGNGAILLKCSRAGVPMSRRSVGIRSTNQQQQILFPADRGFEYQQGLLEVPVLWLSKRFQAV